MKITCSKCGAIFYRAEDPDYTLCDVCLQEFIVAGLPVAPVKATNDLTFTGVAKEGEIISIDGRTYEFSKDGTYTGDVRIDISGAAVAATGTLTMNGAAMMGETISIGAEVYTLADNATGKNVDVSTGTKTQAKATLNITGVVVDGETLTIGDETYEIDAGQTLTVPNIGVDCKAHMVQAHNTLTLGGGVPSNGETMTIGTRVYTWKTVLEAADDIKIGTIEECIDNFVAAIAAVSGEGTQFGTGTTANVNVTAVKTNTTTATLTAIIYGTVMNTLATTETMVHASNIFSGATLGGGGDCSAANAVTDIIAAFTSNTTYDITATDGTGDSVVFTCDIAGGLDGSLGNGIESTTTIEHATFDVEKTTGGTDVTAAELELLLVAKLTSASALVSAVGGAGTSVVITAKAAGAEGNAITTTETMGHGSFGSDTLTGGVDASAPNAVTATVTAITNDALARVTAADVDGDVVRLTAKQFGEYANVIPTSTDCENASFTTTFLAGGVNGTPGFNDQVLSDSTHMYISTDKSTVTVSNWMKKELESL